MLQVCKCMWLSKHDKKRVHDVWQKKIEEQNMFHRTQVTKQTWEGDGDDKKKRVWRNWEDIKEVKSASINTIQGHKYDDDV